MRPLRGRKSMTHPGVLAKRMLLRAKESPLEHHRSVSSFYDIFSTIPDVLYKPMKKIVAIGGGVMKTGGLLAIDEEIIGLSGKKHPKLLFLPTATSDSELYWFYVDKHFGKKLGCKTDVLY